MKTVFFGTPEFSVPSLEVLHLHPNVEVAAVVSMPDRRAGRGKQLQSPPVATFAKENNIPLIQTENINKDEDALKLLHSIEADFFIVIAFAQFLGSKILKMPKLGAFNIHTSLLPKYRGAAPIQYALLNGDKETGVSIQKMVKKMDAGDICYEHKVTISDDDTSASLFKRLESEAALGLTNFLETLVKKPDQVSYRQQNDSEATFAPTIKKQDGLINPFNFSATEILNQLRAYTPWPGLFIFISDQRLKVTELELFPQSLEAGQIDHKLGALLLGTKEGTLRLKSVQPEGKKPQEDKNYLNGLKSKSVIPTLDRNHYE